jgi:hypothetical protein
VKNVYEPKQQTNKYYAIKLNQICRRIELCIREIILRFEMNFRNNTFFLTVLFIFVFVKLYQNFYLKQPLTLTLTTVEKHSLIGNTHFLECYHSDCEDQRKTAFTILQHKHGYWKIDAHNKTPSQN